MQWATQAARYRDPETGRFISRAQVRDVLDRIIGASQTRIRNASNELRAGRLDLGAWDAMMRREIKRTQLSAEALARGGWNQLTANDFGRVGSRVKTQYRYLENFLDELRSGMRTDGRMMQRAEMYAGAARGSFHKSQQLLLSSLGYTHERNLLGRAEHCPTCLDMSALGWVEIGTLIPIGERDCLTACRCDLKYAARET